MFKLQTLTVMTATALCSAAVAASSGFSSFTPLHGEIEAGSLPEAAPFLLSSPRFVQKTLVVRDPLNARRFDSGSWDMQTLNETGADAGRYLFSVFETRQAGVQRTDLQTGVTQTIWHSPAAAPAPNSYRFFDAARWTPWGTLLTAEESWSDPHRPASQYGRAFEIINPLADPAGIRIRPLSVLPRVSHEGMAFDRHNNFYFIDERNGSHVFKYTSQTPSDGATFWDAGETSVLRVGDGTVKEATGAASWVAITDARGAPLENTIVKTDPNGAIVLDGRATPKIAPYLGTGFDRPEDLEIQTLANGEQRLYVATTGSHKVFSIDLASTVVKLFVSRDTRDMATGVAVGEAFSNPDNLAIDADGNLYVSEDQPGGKASIWFVRDDDRDGVAEEMGIWATLATVGAEPTGIYFDPFNPKRMFVNVQHPASGFDRTIEISATPVSTIEAAP